MTGWQASPLMNCNAVHKLVCRCRTPLLAVKLQHLRSRPTSSRQLSTAAQSNLAAGDSNLKRYLIRLAAHLSPSALLRLSVIANSLLMQNMGGIWTKWQ